MDCSWEREVSEMLSTREKKPGEEAYDILETRFWGTIDL